MTLYERIRKLRQAANMSQEDLAHAMGYKDRSMITKIESGKVDISQKKILEFARVLNTTPGYLMGWEDSNTQEVLAHAFNDYYEEKGYPPAVVVPKNDDIRLLVRDLNKLSPEQVEQAKEMFRLMFKVTNPELFKEDNDDET